MLSTSSPPAVFGFLIRHCSSKSELPKFRTMLHWPKFHILAEIPFKTGNRISAAEGGKTVTHLQFLHHFNIPHCKMMCNCRYEKVSRVKCRVKCISGVTCAYERLIWGEERWRGNTAPALAYSFQKAPRGPSGLTSPSEGRIAINSTYAEEEDNPGMSAGICPGA